MKRSSTNARRVPTRPLNYPKGRWLRVAIGDKGDNLEWKAGYEALENVRGHLCGLEEFGEERADLASHFENLPFFEPLAQCSFPPLHDESDFDNVGFMKHEESLGWRENRWVGFSSAEVRVYVWSSKRKELLSQARVLARRLEATLEILDQEKKDALQTKRRSKNSKRDVCA